MEKVPVDKMRSQRDEKLPAIAEKNRESENDPAEKHPYGVEYVFFNEGLKGYVDVSFRSVTSVEEITSTVAQIEADLGPTIGIDVMGQGKPIVEAGCKVAIASTLDIPTNPRIQELYSQIEKSGIELHQGDLFNAEHTKNIFANIDKEISAGGNLSLVLFRPKAGLMFYFDEYSLFIDNAVEYAERYLVTHVFKPLYDRLTPGGLMLLDLSTDTQLTNDQIKRFCSFLDNYNIPYTKEGEVFKITK